MQQCKRVHKCEPARAHACSCPICVNCKEPKSLPSGQGRNKTRILARIMANWKALYTRLEDYASA